MTQNKAEKTAARERRARTGEPYTAALRAARAEPASREALLRVIGENRDTWMTSFLVASHRIGVAVADGRVTEQDMRDYPTGGSYPADRNRALALSAGLLLTDGPGLRGSDAGPPDVTGEDVGVAVEAIMGIVSGDVGVGEGTWYFEDDTVFSGAGTTLEAVRAAMVRLGIRDAAALIVEADLRVGMSFPVGS